MTAKEPAKRTFTVLVVPHSASAPLSFKLSLRSIQLLCTVMVLLVVGLVVFLGSYHGMMARADEVDNLRAINVQQKQQIGELVSRVEGLQVRLAELDELDKQLRVMLELDLGYGETSGAVIAAASNSEVGELGIGGGRDMAEREPSTVRDLAVESQNERTFGDPSLRDTVQLAHTIGEVHEQLGTRRASLEAVALALQDELSFLMARPTGWPLQGIITSDFGLRRDPFGWGQEFHDGIDIAAPSGTPIHVTADGAVTFAGWESGFGRVVVIRHGFGFETRYAHNSRVLVSVGDRVSRGDIIAHVGNTGRSTGSHVHYEVRRYGRKLNPREFLEPPTG